MDGKGEGKNLVNTWETKDGAVVTSIELTGGGAGGEETVVTASGHEVTFWDAAQVRKRERMRERETQSKTVKRK